ncbi:RING/FYVE/PHD zinc finger superfamily protein [Abeliophyllum distichum]|uniref:RING/FYVE/PHD zinc finger superfamily protein n=1 Tax=Abeliophyllum distichum TaxID=126358 RepID=A0ABD1STA6_9LAMI
MQHGDYTSIPYYQQQQYPQTHNPNRTGNPNSNPNPNPIDDLNRYPPLPPLSYASAPPVAPNNYTPPPASSADYSTTSYQHNSPSYPHFPPNPEPIPTAPSFQQPQSSFSFPEVYAQYKTPPLGPPQQPQQQSYYSSYDHPAANYSPNPKPLGPNTQYPPLFTSQFSQSNPPVYDSPVKYDHPGGYFDGNYDGRGGSEFGSDLYGKQPESGYGGYGKNDGGYGKNDGAYENNEGVYAYKGSSSEPYGARGTAPKSSTSSGFDDFGRPIGYSSPSGKERSTNTGLKVVKAVPKAESQQDTKGGVQKYRVKLLAESAGQSTMDVLCQIGLDGIRMLDPATSRILRIYPLDTITRCSLVSALAPFLLPTLALCSPRNLFLLFRLLIHQHSLFGRKVLWTLNQGVSDCSQIVIPPTPFWIRLLLQLYSLRRWAEEAVLLRLRRLLNCQLRRRKALQDWVNKIKPVNEEKDHWVPDEAVTKCTGCGTDFSAFVRKHHCRNCGDIFCDKCTQGRTALTADETAPVVRVCDRCLAEVSRRLSTAKDSVSGSTGLQSHEDLAKKLQEEMERNRRALSGSRSDGSGRRMKEVACPTCTVHLQVQIPSSGSETIECGVCQHPFLVSSH